MLGIILAGAGTVACFLGDWFNNTVAIVDANAVHTWVGIVGNAGMISVAFGFALSVPLIGFYVGVRKKYYLGLVVAIVCSCGLTVFGRYSMIETKEVRAAAQVEYKRSLIEEKANLNKSLYPTDGTAPCKLQRWCVSSEKERRLSEISSELLNLSQTGITGTPGDHKKIMDFGILGIMGLGLPIVAGTLSGMIGWRLSERRNKKQQAQSINEWVNGGETASKITRIDRFKKKLSSLGTGIKKRFKSGAKTGSQKQLSNPSTGKNEAEPVPESSICYYKAAKKAVLEQGIKPSYNALNKHGIRGRKAQILDYLKRMANENILIPPAKNGGGYKLNTEYGTQDKSSISDIFKRQTA